MQLSLVTYNIYFGGNMHGNFRHPILLQTVEKLSPDIIGFQECQKPFLDYLLQLPWVQQSYYISDATGATINSYGCLLLSKIVPSQLIIQEFPTYMGRKLIAGEFLVNGKKLRVGTVHLESYPKDTPYRKRQLEIATKVLGAVDMGILMGDFNFPDGEENAFISSDFVDLWKVKYPTFDTEESKGYTFDYKKNKMTQATHVYVRHRLDRIFVQSTNKTSLENIEIIGTDPIDLAAAYGDPKLTASITQQLWPSDHFGLAAIIGISEAKSVESSKME